MVFCYALSMVSGLAFACSTDEAPADLVQRASAALYGKLDTTRIRPLLVKMSGIVKVDGNDVHFVDESIVQWPDRRRSQLQLEVNNKAHTVFHFLNGRDGWMTYMGQTHEVSPEGLRELQDGVYRGQVTTLQPLMVNQDEFTLSAIESIQIDGKAALGLKVASKGQHDIKLYFDKSTLLLRRLESLSWDAEKKKLVPYMIEINAYAEIDGRKVPKRVTLHQDGQKVSDAEILEWKLLDRVDDSLFIRPKP